MAFKLALTGTTGKLGGAVLTALLQYKLAEPSSIVISTSSDPNAQRWNDLKAQGTELRQANFDDQASLELAFADCDRAFIVSSTVISLDFHDCAQGGREKHHIAAIDAAIKAGVKHIYYTSLAFADDSKSEVMRAHLVTEQYLKDNSDKVSWTSIREGLYNESWPLYFGHWEVGKDNRKIVKVAGDGPLSWTAIPDLGLANAKIIVDEAQKWKNKIITLSAIESHTLKDIAARLSELKGYEIQLQMVSRDEHERYYIDERNEESGHIRWWSRTYDALPDGEARQVDGLLEELLMQHGRKPISLQTTLSEMEA